MAEQHVFSSKRPTAILALLLAFTYASHAAGGEAVCSAGQIWDAVAAACVKCSLAGGAKGTISAPPCQSNSIAGSPNATAPSSAGSTTACVPAEEVCNGKDDDCDGEVDEGVISCGEGACFTIINMCYQGEPQTCKRQPPSKEVCDGIDNDCDGKVDDGLGTISCGQGACLTVINACFEGRNQTCTPNPAGKEVCDGIDNDCDGEVDEGLGTVTCGKGACKVTVDKCVNATEQTCTPGAPEDEVCDGIDNDCNGQVDEGTITCGKGACAVTMNMCASGKKLVCKPLPVGEEVCDGIDNDCDGQVDEGLGSITCGTGACQRSVPQCVDGKLQTCTPGATKTETCNGEDDDCDGVVDDVGSLTCGRGACKVTVDKCVDGKERDMSSCQAGSPSKEVCDGIDNDCDGQVDEGLGSIFCPPCNKTTPACKGGRNATCAGVCPRACCSDCQEWYAGSEQALAKCNSTCIECVPIDSSCSVWTDDVAVQVADLSCANAMLGCKMLEFVWGKDALAPPSCFGDVDAQLCADRAATFSQSMDAAPSTCAFFIEQAAQNFTGECPPDQAQALQSSELDRLCADMAAGKEVELPIED